MWRFTAEILSGEKHRIIDFRLQINWEKSRIALLIQSLLGNKIHFFKKSKSQNLLYTELWVFFNPSLHLYNKFISVENSGTGKNKVKDMPKSLKNRGMKPKKIDLDLLILIIQVKNAYQNWFITKNTLTSINKKYNLLVIPLKVFYCILCQF